MSESKEVTQPITPRMHKTKVTELNFSFLSLTDVFECEKIEPRCETSKSIPKKNKDGLYNASCIRLNNNLISKLNDFTTFLSHIIINPDQLTWIDLSCNELPEIPLALGTINSLRILLLHGNQIKEIDEVDKLLNLPELHKLTLHGNPLETVKVIYICITLHITYMLYKICHIYMYILFC
ncbi:DgyrCDS9036 [Dimorphilus gyrociliatus]|uniref:Leucine-rich repeat-containing protein 51 n=1 Tax=Dimorphilus gyrociliatus TaxID=2664684 RepID=A0A7I8VX61_9ANNE|nr:DgyrCDS9036 [Dimorphilus gyrociliatus]